MLPHNKTVYDPALQSLDSELAVSTSIEMNPLQNAATASISDDE